ncbi:MAG TPA: hypothetical protein VL221_06510 [Bacteroidota bacterium]|nr:hypothetical protein [Bacteroidota bacterium]
MTCNEFQQAYNTWLDGRKATLLPPEAGLHAEICPACRRYAAAMDGVDAGLRRIPPVQVPAGLLALTETLAIPGPAQGRVRRIAAFGKFWAPAVIPAAALWSAGLFLPPAWAGALCFLLMTSGLVMFGVASLRPRFSET